MATGRFVNQKLGKRQSRRLELVRRQGAAARPRQRRRARGGGGAGAGGWAGGGVAPAAAPAGPEGSVSGRVRMGVVGISLLVVAYVVGGSLLGRTAGEGAYKQLAVFGEVLSQIHANYVEEPNLQRVTVGALHGLLTELDPYSGYLSPREYAEYQQKQPPPEGRVGVVLSKRFWL